ncbi:MAG: hypothetical protein WC756_17640 [Taibaiella sp.]|jgi:hypothetical protein
MNIQNWKWWASLSPAKQTRLALAFIAFISGSAYFTGSKATTANLRSEVKEKAQTIKDKDLELKVANTQLNECKDQKTAIVREYTERDKEEDRKEIEELKADGKRKDSITAKLNQALYDAEKAKRNAKK